IYFSISFTFSDHNLLLHPFPTRRSSDLLPRRPLGQPGSLPRGPLRHYRGATTRSKPLLDSGSAWWLPRGRFSIMTKRTSWQRTRSEEHTSELQSRGHLVCRLLLEKKN